MSVCPICAKTIELGQSRMLAAIDDGLYKYCHRACVDKRIAELESRLIALQAENESLRDDAIDVVRQQFESAAISSWKRAYDELERKLATEYERGRLDQREADAHIAEVFGLTYSRRTDYPLEIAKAIRDQEIN